MPLREQSLSQDASQRTVFKERSLLRTVFEVSLLPGTVFEVSLPPGTVFRWELFPEQSLTQGTVLEPL